MAEDQLHELVEQLLRLARDQVLVERKVHELHDLLRKVYEGLSSELARFMDGELLVLSDIRVTPARAHPAFEWDVRFHGQELLGFTCQADTDPFWQVLVARCEIREGGGRRATAKLCLLREGEGADWYAVEENGGVPGGRRSEKMTEGFLLDLLQRYLRRVYPDYGEL